MLPHICGYKIELTKFIVSVIDYKTLSISITAEYLLTSNIIDIYWTFDIE